MAEYNLKVGDLVYVHSCEFSGGKSIPGMREMIGKKYVVQMVSSGNVFVKINNYAWDYRDLKPVDNTPTPEKILFDVNNLLLE